MPTATSTHGWTLANVGPAPTTYSVPPSCTASSIWQIELTTRPGHIYWGNKCYGDELTDCRGVPTDPVLRDATSTNPYVLPIHSPGLECPSGFKTLGAIGRPQTDGPVTSEGIYTLGLERANRFGDIWGYYYGLSDAVGDLLDPGETLIACCPSEMTIGTVGNCYSTLPPRPISTGCLMGFYFTDDETISTTYVANGTTFTGDLILDMPPATTRADHTSFDPTITSDLAAVTSFPAMLLFHKPSDVGGGGGGDIQAETETEPSGTNAAAGLYRAETGWQLVMGMVGALVVSVVAGMGIVLPW
ncbi:hypothetical protein BJX61DRAFT_549402 [Aspergillus egyptiacus]|nr:hypothetical protein BJX61DRAFT_549402 [Aspergillus egyptiacus]